MANIFQDLLKKGIKVKLIGQKEKIPKALSLLIERLVGMTKNNKGMTVNVALSYGGRAEITEAIRNIMQKKIPPKDITEKVISDKLWASDVDLLIRTGKEQRISNFLIWQTAYSELYFCPKYWPDFTEEDLNRAIKSYLQRQRRFGK